jgi:hypothetical protein
MDGPSALDQFCRAELCEVGGIKMKRFPLSFSLSFGLLFGLFLGALTMSGQDPLGLSEQAQLG